MSPTTVCLAIMALNLPRMDLGQYVVLMEVLMNHDNKPPREIGEVEGRYANYFKVGHNAFEFLFDFGQFYAESQRAQFHTRIITNPIYAKSLLGLLRQSLERYEQTFGAIPREDAEGA